MMGLPPYLSPAEIAVAVAARTGNGEDARDLRKQCERAGILEKDGTHYYHVGQSRLRERLPEIYEACFDYYVIEGNPLKRA